MKFRVLMFVFCAITLSAIGQEFEKGTIITQRHDTIANVEIEKMSDAKSILHVTYKDADGVLQSPDIETVKCYSRGAEIFCRIYSSGEMIMAKKIAEGAKLNLYLRDQDGFKTYYIEKVYDELIKVPSSSGKFKKVLSEFLSESPQIAGKIKSEELNNIEEIVTLYNRG